MSAMHSGPTTTPPSFTRFTVSLSGTAATPLPYFFCARLVCAALAALFCEGLLRLFPCPVNTVSLGSVGAPQMFSFSAPAAFAMLLSGAMLILELDTNEKKC